MNKNMNKRYNNLKRSLSETDASASASGSGSLKKYYQNVDNLDSSTSLVRTPDYSVIHHNNKPLIYNQYPREVLQDSQSSQDSLFSGLSQQDTHEKITPIMPNDLVNIYDTFYKAFEEQFKDVLERMKKGSKGSIKKYEIDRYDVQKFTQEYIESIRICNNNNANPQGIQRTIQQPKLPDNIFNNTNRTLVCNNNFEYPFLSYIARKIKNDSQYKVDLKIEKNNFILLKIAEVGKEIDRNVANNREDSSSAITSKIFDLTIDGESPSVDSMIVLIKDMEYILQKAFEYRFGNSYVSERIIYKRLLEDTNNNITVATKIKVLLNDNHFQIMYNQCKFIIDACDLIHDIETIKGKDKLISSLSIIAYEIDGNTNGYASQTFNELRWNISTAPSKLQELIHIYKEKANKHLFDYLRSKSIPFPELTGQELTKAEGHITMIKSYMNDTIKDKTVYQESGRIYDFSQLPGFIAEYSGNFYKECAEECGYFNNNNNEPDEKKMEIEIDRIINDHSDPPNNNKLLKDPLPSCTLDGFGTTDKNKHIYRYQKYTFDRLFGYFQYQVHTLWHKKWVHLVVVYKENKLVAGICLLNNATIAMLLESLDEITVRGGDGGKGEVVEYESTVTWFYEKKKINQHLQTSLLNLNKPISHAKLDHDNYRTQFGKIRSDFSEHINTIVLGIKTCGDLVVYTHIPDCHLEPQQSSNNIMETTVVTTTDKGIAESVLVNYILLSANSSPEQKDPNVLGVLRQVARGWSYTAGKTEQDLDAVAKSIEIKLVSYYYFLETFDNSGGVLTNSFKTILKNLGITPTITIHRFRQFQEALQTFNSKKGVIMTEGTFDRIMVELLKNEFIDIERRITIIINQIRDLSNRSDKLDYILNNFKDLDKYFVSNIATAYINNSSIPGLFTENGKPPLPSMNYLPKVDINKISNEIKIIYIVDNNPPLPTDENDVTFRSTVIKVNNSGRKRYNYEITISSPITLDLLIQLKYKINDMSGNKSDIIEDLEYHIKNIIADLEQKSQLVDDNKHEKIQTAGKRKTHNRKKRRKRKTSRKPMSNSNNKKTHSHRNQHTKRKTKKRLKRK